MINEKIPELHAAKVLLTLRERPDEYIFVAGERGRLNLPGGGIDMGEDAQEALLRELAEELNLTPEQIAHLEEIGGTKARVDTKSGEIKTAVWHLFEGELDMSPDELSYGSEVTNLAIMSVEQYSSLADTQTSKLAKNALRFSTGIDARELAKNIRPAPFNIDTTVV